MLATALADEPSCAPPEKDLAAFMASEAWQNEEQAAKVIDWIKVHNVEKKADSEIVTALAKPVYQFTGAGHNFAVVIGSGLTADQKPFLLCGWAGEFFPFELTAVQAANLRVGPTSLGANANRRYGKRLGKTTVELSDLNIRNATSIDGGKPIKGTVGIQRLRDFKDSTNLHLRLDLKFAGFIDMRLEEVPAIPDTEGTLRFAFTPINPPGDNDKPSRGVVAAFVNLVEKAPDDDKTKLIMLSNTVGMMLEID